MYFYMHFSHLLSNWGRIQLKSFETKANVLGDHWVFVPPLVYVYYDAEEFRIIVDWNSVI